MPDPWLSLQGCREAVASQSLATSSNCSSSPAGQCHARDFRERTGFMYSILDGDEVIGCVDIYPPRREGFDPKVRSWVRASRAAMDDPVWRLLSAWLTTEWPLERLDFAPRA